MKLRPGITLPELLVSIGVLGLIVAVVANLYVGSGRFARDEGIRIEVGENAARLLGPADEILRQGKRVLGSGPVTINGTNYTTGTNTLVFTVPSLLSDNTLSPTEIDTAVLFVDTTQASNARLWLKLQPSGSSIRPAIDQSVVEQVNEVYFRYTTPNPDNATGLTLTLSVTETVSQRAFTRINILYAVFRNRI